MDENRVSLMLHLHHFIRSASSFENALLRFNQVIGFDKHFADRNNKLNHAAKSLYATDNLQVVTEQICNSVIASTLSHDLQQCLFDLRPEILTTISNNKIKPPPSFDANSIGQWSDQQQQTKPIEDDDCEIIGEKTTNIGMKQNTFHTQPMLARKYKCFLCAERFSTSSGFAHHRKSHSDQDEQLWIIRKQNEIINNLQQKKPSVHPTPVMRSSSDFCNTQQQQYELSTFHPAGEGRRVLNTQGQKSNHGNRKYVCFLCDKRFLTSNSLRKHRKRMHTDEEERMWIQKRTELISKTQINQRVEATTPASSVSNPVPTIIIDLEANSQDQDSNPLLRSPALNNDDNRSNDSTALQNSSAPLTVSDDSQISKSTDSNRFSVFLIRYKCCVCDKRFYGYKELREHKSSVHTVEEERMCIRKRKNKHKHRKKPPGKFGQTPASMDLNSRRHFECYTCGRRYTLRRSLMKHQMNKHMTKEEIQAMRNSTKNNEESEFKCKLCPRVFNSSDKLRRHKVVHSDARPHKCDLCPFAAKQRKGLLRHFNQLHAVEALARKAQRKILWNKHAKPKIRCDTCFKVFFFVSTLEEHKKRFHLENNNLFCKICKKTFACELDLTEHGTIDCTVEELFECTKCELGFQSKPLLNQHTQSAHSLKPPSEIDKSKSTVDTEAALPDKLPENKPKKKRQRLTSNKEHLIKCDVCDTMFHTLALAEKHKNRFHSEDKKHKCSICNISFIRSDYLLKHNRIHTGEKPYKCGLCKNEYSRRSNLNVHLKWHDLHDSPKKTVQQESCFNLDVEADDE